LLTRPSIDISRDSTLSTIALPLILSLLIIFIISPAKSALARDIALNLLSVDNPTYRKVSNLTVSLFKEKCVTDKCRNITFKNSSSISTTEDYIFSISYGTKAAVESVDNLTENLLIRTMIPKQLTPINTSVTDDNRILNIYIDQPFARYLSLIKNALPRATRVGILIHASNHSMLEEYNSVAEKMGLSLEIATVDNDGTGKALSSILSDIDALLALPDSRIHNSKTIPNILTTAYRNKIPIIGFSSAYTRAGAVASVFTSIEDIANETSDAAIEFFYQKTTPIQRNSAKYFSISINHDVARSLGLNISSEENIIKSIK
jgi:hypothetical protein